MKKVLSPFESVGINSIPNSFKVKNKFLYYYKRLIPFIKPFWKLSIFATITLIFSSLLSLPIPLITKFLIDNVLPSQNLKLLKNLLLLLASLTFVGAILNVVQQYYLSCFEQKVLISIQQRLYNRVLRLPKSFFDNTQTGYLMSRLMSDVFQLKLLFSRTTMQIGSNIIRFAGSICILFFLHWQLTLFSLLILPFFVYSVRSFSKKARIFSNERMEKNALVSQCINESISGLELIKTYSTENKETQKLFNTLLNSSRINIHIETFNGFTQFILTLISALGTLLVFYYGGSEIVANRMSIGSFVAYNGYLAYLYGPTRFLAQSNINLQSSLAALDRVFSLFDIVPEDENDRTKNRINKLNGKIEFSNIYFRYNHKDILRNINFKVFPGELVAVVGPTGSGKSTLVNLILGLYRSQKGDIKLDGIPISEIALKDLREHIGIVSQQIFLFDDTILNNIKYSNPKANNEKVISASQKAMAHEFILELENGYHTIIGERGVKLSVGQKQRLSIARALLKNPDVYIFDEPTSAIDALTEDAIKHLVFEQKPRKTTFLIAHRLSTTVFADKIIVLKNGSIENIGTHNYLYKINNIYREMCDEQFITLQ